MPSHALHRIRRNISLSLTHFLISNNNNRFVVLCETFLQMYNSIFGSLPAFLTDDIYWTKSNYNNSSSSNEGLYNTKGLNSSSKNNNSSTEIEQRTFSVSGRLLLWETFFSHRYSFVKNCISLKNNLKRQILKTESIYLNWQMSLLLLGTILIITILSKACLKWLFLSSVATF